MTCTLAIASATSPMDVMGTRYGAIELRESIEQRLESCQTVQLAPSKYTFAGTNGVPSTPADLPSVKIAPVLT